MKKTGRAKAGDPDVIPTCTGACCDPVTMDVENYRAIASSPGNYHNGRYIIAMLQARGRIPRTGTVKFDCKYFDHQERRCTAYARRPKMCRTFPDTGLCLYCGGEFPDGRSGPEEPEES